MRARWQVPVLLIAMVLVAAGIVAAALADSDDTARPPSSTSTTSTTHVSAPTDPRLLSALDLGTDFEDTVFRPIEDDTVCTFAVPSDPRPHRRVGASYSSQDAQENATSELVEYADARDAADALAAIARTSDCAMSENHVDGAFTAIDIAGAEQAHSMAFADPKGSESIEIGLVQETIVIVHVELHFGPATRDGIPAHELLALAVARATPPLPPTVPSGVRPSRRHS